MSMDDIKNGLNKHHFWEFNIGHLILILIAVGSLMIWWANFSTLPRETADALAVLSKTVEKINDKGTFAGQLDTQRQTGINNSLDARLLVLEKNYGTLNDNVVEIKTQLKVIATLLDAKQKK